MGTSKTAMSVDEIISTLKHSRLRSVIVEGKDDIIVYRHLERIYRPQALSVIGAGGRDNIIRIWERRSEIGREMDIVFLVDKDKWVLDGTPTEFDGNGLITTDGYSIENDVIQDQELLSLMSSKERSQFKLELDEFLNYYSLAYERHTKDNGEPFDMSAQQFFSNSQFTKQAQALRTGEIFPNALKQKIMKNYIRTVRGKSLMGLMMRQLSYRGRVVNHRSDIFLDLGGSKAGPLVSRIFDEVGRFFHQNGK